MGKCKKQKKQSASETRQPARQLASRHKAEEPPSRLAGRVPASSGEEQASTSQETTNNQR